MNDYFSLSEYPGRTGAYFYGYFFAQHGLTATYTPMGVSPENFDAQFNQLVQSGASGISISMPYKTHVIRHLDDVDASVSHYGSCNTVVRESGRLKGYNCDLAGVKHTCKYIVPGDSVHILGNGAMGRMFKLYLASQNHSNVTVYSRSLDNWHQRHEPADVIINCTALGTIHSASPLDRIPDDVHTVIDLALKPSNLKFQCHNQARYIPGQEFYMHQFMQQFSLYTKCTVSETEFQQAQELI